MFLPLDPFFLFPFSASDYDFPLLWQDLVSVLLVKYRALLSDVKYEGITSKQCRKKCHQLLLGEATFISI